MVCESVVDFWKRRKPDLGASLSAPQSPRSAALRLSRPPAALSSAGRGHSRTSAAAPHGHRGLHGRLRAARALPGGAQPAVSRRWLPLAQSPARGNPSEQEGEVAAAVNAP